MLGVTVMFNLILLGVQSLKMFWLCMLSLCMYFNFIFFSNSRKILYFEIEFMIQENPVKNNKAS